MTKNCSVRNCKSIRKKDSQISFHRFPLKDERTLKYWIAATGRNNWSPHADAVVCSLHFRQCDYTNNENKRKRLKPDSFPTQYVNENILQMFNTKVAICQINAVKNSHVKNTMANENQNNILNKENVKHDQLNKCIARNTIPEVSNEENTICSKCADVKKILHENEQLKMEIQTLRKSQEERLNNLASMFKKVIHEKETVWREKVKKLRQKSNTLHRNIERKQNKIIYLKKLIEHLKQRSNIIHDDSFQINDESD